MTAVNCVDFCKALADETRQKILEMLREEELCVSDIVKAFDMSQPTISHHLHILKQFGLVTSRKEGKQVFYDLDLSGERRICQRKVPTCTANDAKILELRVYAGLFQ